MRARVRVARASLRLRHLVKRLCWSFCESCPLQSETRSAIYKYLYLPFQPPSSAFILSCSSACNSSNLPSNMADTEETPSQRQARIRREKREAKIIGSGTERLDKITRLSGRTPESSMNSNYSARLTILIFQCEMNPQHRFRLLHLLRNPLVQPPILRMRRVLHKRRPKKNIYENFSEHLHRNRDKVNRNKVNRNKVNRASKRR
jgi:hypothetical protein